MGEYVLTILVDTVIRERIVVEVVCFSVCMPQSLSWEVGEQ